MSRISWRPRGSCRLQKPSKSFVTEEEFVENVEYAEAAIKTSLGLEKMTFRKVLCENLGIYFINSKII